VPLFNKGVELTNLFSSNVFQFKFDYDEWPGIHTEQDFFIRPFNDSVFRVRYMYRDVFPEDKF